MSYVFQGKSDKDWLMKGSASVQELKWNPWIFLLPQCPWLFLTPLRGLTMWNLRASRSPPPTEETRNTETDTTVTLPPSMSSLPTHPLMQYQNTMTMAVLTLPQTLDTTREHPSARPPSHLTTLTPIFLLMNNLLMTSNTTSNISSLQEKNITIHNSPRLEI